MHFTLWESESFHFFQDNNQWHFLICSNLYGLFYWLSVLLGIIQLMFLMEAKRTTWSPKSSSKLYLLKMRPSHQFKVILCPKSLRRLEDRPITKVRTKKRHLIIKTLKNKKCEFNHVIELTRTRSHLPTTENRIRLWQSQWMSANKEEIKR